MTQVLTSQGLLILIAPPNLEEMLVDLLLQQTSISGFTSSKVSGHGTAHDTGHGDGSTKLSIVEQVTGRQQRVQFMLHAALTDLQDLVTTLKARFKNTDMHYILMPIADSQII